MKRMRALLGATIGAAALAGTLVAGGASVAEPQPEAPAVTSEVTPQRDVVSWYMLSNRYPVQTATTAYGQVQIRVGARNGIQYGYGWSPWSKNVPYVRFELDTDGDRRPNRSAFVDLRSDQGTVAFRASSSSNVAFRACFTFTRYGGCVPSLSTAWW